MSDDLYCTVCGRASGGPHPSSCNGPGQDFVTKEELRRRNRPINPPKPMSAEEHRERRRAALERARAELAKKTDRKRKSEL